MPAGAAIGTACSLAVSQRANPAIRERPYHNAAFWPTNKANLLHNPLCGLAHHNMPAEPSGTTVRPSVGKRSVRPFFFWLSAYSAAALVILSQPSSWPS
jgi:hypothetical protein